MCGNKNIENLNQVLCALKERHRDKVIREEGILLDKDELSALEVEPNRYYYGILSIGKDTAVEIEMLGGALFEIPENNQIIELFQGITLTGTNALFRGYALTVQGQ